MMNEHYIFKKETVTKAKESCDSLFREIGNGVYVVDKDRYGNLDKFADTFIIAQALNSNDKIAVVRFYDGCIITNFDINNKVTVNKDKELYDTGSALLYKKETILNKQQAKELFKTAEMANTKSLKDQTVNLTVNVNYDKAIENSNELFLNVSKFIEEAIKQGKSLR